MIHGKGEVIDGFVVLDVEVAGYRYAPALKEELAKAVLEKIDACCGGKEDGDLAEVSVDGGYVKTLPVGVWKQAAAEIRRALGVGEAAAGGA